MLHERFEKVSPVWQVPCGAPGKIALNAVLSAAGAVIGPYQDICRGKLIQSDLEQKDKKVDDPRSVVIKELDLAAEYAMVESLHANGFAGHIIGEECGLFSGQDGSRAYLDGIDGSIHARYGVHGLWAHQCSIIYKDEVVAAAIGMPSTGQFFVTAKGRGVWLYEATRVEGKIIWHFSSLHPDFATLTPTPGHLMGCIWRGSSKPSDNLMQTSPLCSLRRHVLLDDDPFIWSSTSLTTLNMIRGQIHFSACPLQSPWDFAPQFIFLRELGFGGQLLIFEPNDWEHPIPEAEFCQQPIDQARRKFNTLAAVNEPVLQLVARVCRENPQPSLVEAVTE